MSDTKISLLQPANPLNGTEPWPIVQSGVTVRTSGSELANYLSSAFLPTGIVDNTELGYLAGTTSPIQSQLNVLKTGNYWKEACRVSTTDSSPMRDLDPVDDVVLKDGDRILVQFQNDPTKNGIYLAKAGAWLRATDFDDRADHLCGAVVAIQEGTVYKNKAFICNSVEPIRLGIDSIGFSLFGGRIYTGRPGELGIDDNNVIGFDSTIGLSFFLGRDNTTGSNNIIFSQLTGNTVPYLNGGRQLTSSAVTPTELGYVHGVTGSIQTQINGALTQINDVKNSLYWKEACRVSTTMPMALFGLPVVDNVQLQDNDRVLVQFDSDLPRNGIYVAKSGSAWQRADDFNERDDTMAGSVVAIQDGTLYKNKAFICSNTEPIDIDAQDITFSLFGGRVYAGVTGQITVDDDNNIGLDSEITAQISSKQDALNGTGFVKMAGTTVSYDNSTYLTGNQSITVSGQATGSGTTSLNLTLDNDAVMNKRLTSYTANTSYPIANGETISSGLQKAQSLSNLTTAIVIPDDTHYPSTKAVQNYITARLADGGYISGVSGTAGRISVSGTTIDIAGSYVGQNTITTLGTVATGVWHGTAIADAYISSAASWNAKQAALSGTGLVRSAGGTISYDTATYITGNQTITLSGQASGSGTTSISVTLDNDSVTAKRLGGFVAGATTGDIAADDSIISAFEKAQLISKLATTFTTTDDAHYPSTKAVETYVTNRLTDSGYISGISGTSGRISVSGTTVDISSSYVGQNTITTLGTVATGVWHGTAIADAYISSAATWNAKQPALSGTGFVKISGTSISYDTSTYQVSALRATLLSADDTHYPTTNAVKSYVDAALSGIGGGTTYTGVSGEINVSGSVIGISSSYEPGLTNTYIAVGDGSNKLSSTSGLRYDGTTFYTYGKIQSDSLAGSSSRIVETDSDGNLGATRDIIDQWISESYVVDCLQEDGNWSDGNYMGPPLDNTYQSQTHFSSTYFYICTSDGNWIRMMRA